MLSDEDDDMLDDLLKDTADLGSKKPALKKSTPHQSAAPVEKTSEPAPVKNNSDDFTPGNAVTKPAEAEPSRNKSRLMMDLFGSDEPKQNNTSAPSSGFASLFSDDKPSSSRPPTTGREVSRKKESPFDFDFGSPVRKKRDPVDFGSLSPTRSRPATRESAISRTPSTSPGHKKTVNFEIDTDMRRGGSSGESRNASRESINDSYTPSDSKPERRRPRSAAPLKDPLGLFSAPTKEPEHSSSNNDPLSFLEAKPNKTGSRPSTSESAKPAEKSKKSKHQSSESETEEERSTPASRKVSNSKIAELEDRLNSLTNERDNLRNSLRNVEERSQEEIASMRDLYKEQMEILQESQRMKDSRMQEDFENLQARYKENMERIHEETEARQSAHTNLLKNIQKSWQEAAEEMRTWYKNLIMELYQPLMGELTKIKTTQETMNSGNQQQAVMTMVQDHIAASEFKTSRDIEELKRSISQDNEMAKSQLSKQAAMVEEFQKKFSGMIEQQQKMHDLWMDQSKLLNERDGKLNEEIQEMRKLKLDLVKELEELKGEREKVKVQNVEVEAHQGKLHNLSAEIYNCSGAVESMCKKVADLQVAMADNFQQGSMRSAPRWVWEEDPMNVTNRMWAMKSQNIPAGTAPPRALERPFSYSSSDLRMPLLLQWQMQANKDKNFLEKEARFLHQTKGRPDVGPSN